MTSPALNVYEWRGEKYHGIASVARAASVAPSTVAHHLSTHGHLDRLGIGHQCNWPSGPRSKPVHMFGRSWSSRRAMAASLGIHESSLKRWIAAGKTDDILAAVMRADLARAA